MIRVIVDPANQLYDLFPANTSRPWLEVITPEQMPEPFRRLLVHKHHMTVTVEDYYGESVDVKVLETTQTGDLYTRQILLTLRSTGTVVQFGIVTIDLAVLLPEVRQQIVEGKTPLGRVLIEHNVLRTIEPKAFYRARPDEDLAKHFQGAKEVCYGRVGVITTDGHPTITVLEILASRPAHQIS